MEDSDPRPFPLQCAPRPSLGSTDRRRARIVSGLFSSTKKPIEAISRLRTTTGDAPMFARRRIEPNQAVWSDRCAYAKRAGDPPPSNIFIRRGSHPALPETLKSALKSEAEFWVIQWPTRRDAESIVADVFSCGTRPGPNRSSPLPTHPRRSALPERLPRRFRRLRTFPSQPDISKQKDPFRRQAPLSAGLPFKPCALSF